MKLKVKRKGFIGLFLNEYIIINELKYPLRKNDVIVIDLDDGVYKFYIKSLFVKSKEREINLKDSDKTIYIDTFFSTSFTFFLLFIFLMGLLLQKGNYSQDIPRLIAYLAITYIFIHFLISTVGRKYYFTIKIDNK